MIPARVHFTGLEFDPLTIADRWHRGIIPLEWPRHRFQIRHDVKSPTTQLASWLSGNAEGRWSIWFRYSRDNMKEFTVAFELDGDAAIFVLADAQNQAFEQNNELY